MKQKKRYIISAVLSIVFLYLLLANLREIDLKEVFLSLDPYYLFWALIAYTIVAFVRAYRIQAVYSEENVGFTPVMGVSLVHTLISNVVPSRLGEFSFVYLMRKVFGEQFSKNTVALIFIRLLDTFVVAAFFFVSALVVSASLVEVSNLGLLIILAAFLGVMSFYLDALIVVGVLIFKSLVEIMRLNRFQKIQELVGFVETLREIKILQKRGVYWKSLLSTIAAWTFLMLANLAMTKAMGLELSLSLLFFASTGAVLTSLIPVTSFGALGTYELGWIVVFALVGLSQEQAIVTGLTVHALNFLFSLILGGVGFLLIRRRFRES